MCRLISCATFLNSRSFCSSLPEARVRSGILPVGDDRLAGKDRTGFFRPSANSNHDIESGIFKLIPRFAAGVVGINSVLVL